MSYLDSDWFIQYMSKHRPHSAYNDVNQTGLIFGTTFDF